MSDTETSTPTSTRTSTAASTQTSTATANPAETVDFWFDPSCPLTRVTARWIGEVARHRRVEVCWRVMSLSVLNQHSATEDGEVDPEGDTEGYLWVPARICAAVQTEHGHAALGRFYESLWTDALWTDALWTDALRTDEPGSSERDWLGDLTSALRRAGLPEALAEAGRTDRYDAELRASHEAAMSLVGADVGTPILAVTEPSGARHAGFGPVLAELPDAEAALRLWDGWRLLVGVPEFRELKR